MKTRTLPSWTVFSYAMIGGASLTGSLITALGFLSAGVAFWQLRRETAPIPQATALRWSIWVLAAYFAVLAVTTALNGPEPRRFLELIIISPFLYFIPVLLAMARAPAVPDLLGIGRAAMVGGVATAAIALVASLGLGVHRPGLVTGNANLLSSLMVTQAMLCLAGLAQAAPRERLLAVLCASFVLFGLAFGPATRGALLTAGLMAAMSALFLITRLNKRRQLLAWGALIAGFVVALPWILPLADRFANVLAAATDPAYGDWISSGGSRLTMYKAGIALVADHPLTGVGMHERFSGALPYYAVPPPDYIYYTHLHNLLLTHATAGGLPGLAVALAFVCLPTALALRLRGLPTDLRWLGLMLSTCLFGLGLTETILFQDLASTFFITCTVIYAVLCARSATTSSRAALP